MAPASTNFHFASWATRNKTPRSRLQGKLGVERLAFPRAFPLRGLI